MSELANDVRAKILIAEDDAIVALDLQGMVMRLGYDVVALVDTGTAAISAVKRFQPDIVLLDMFLSGSLDGIETAREIHRIIDIPVVFCVSSPDLNALVRAKEVSYSGYLLKPINPDSLSTTLDTVLYKFKLEKRVQKAEEKYLMLADKCEIVRFFFEHESAFEWSWSPEKGVELTLSPLFFTKQKLELIKTIELLVAGEPPETTRKISFSIDIEKADGELQLLGIIGIVFSEDFHATGMIIPLERFSS